MQNPTVSWYLTMIPGVGLGALLALLGLLAYAWLSAPRLLHRALKQGRNAEKFLGWRRISPDAEAIRTVSVFAASTYLWHGVDRVGATPEHAFFYINTTMAIVVPARAFADDRQFKDFVDAARRHWRMGGTAGGAPRRPIPDALPVRGEAAASEGITPEHRRGEGKG